MTEEEALSKCEQLLCTSHLDVFGGYPYASVVIGDKLIVAGLDDSKERNRTEIIVYPVEACIEWGMIYGREFEEGEFDDGIEALYEIPHETHVTEGLGF